MSPNIDPLQTGYTVALITLALVVMLQLVPMGQFERAAATVGSIVLSVGSLYHFGMLPF